MPLCCSPVFWSFFLWVLPLFFSGFFSMFLLCDLLCFWVLFLGSLFVLDSVFFGLISALVFFFSSVSVRPLIELPLPSPAFAGLLCNPRTRSWARDNVVQWPWVAGFSVLNLLDFSPLLNRSLRAKRKGWRTKLPNGVVCILEAIFHFGPWTF